MYIVHIYVLQVDRQLENKSLEFKLDAKTITFNDFKQILGFSRFCDEYNLIN